MVTEMYCIVMTKPFSDIAARIKWHRGLLKLNQENYAALIRANRSALANWEAGHKRISLDAALIMREKFGLSLDFIYEGIEDALPMSLRNELLDKPIDKS
jgi:transcriptional regulator with XRE-family HTH domain